MTQSGEENPVVQRWLVNFLGSDEVAERSIRSLMSWPKNYVEIPADQVDDVKAYLRGMSNGNGKRFEA